MSRNVMVLGGIAFMFLVMSTGVGIMKYNFDNPGPIVVLAILAYVFLKALRLAGSAPSRGPAGEAGPVPEDTNSRIARLEQRMTDMQEIILSIDERLQRLTPKADVGA